MAYRRKRRGSFLRRLTWLKYNKPYRMRKGKINMNKRI